MNSSPQPEARSRPTNFQKTLAVSLGAQDGGDDDVFAREDGDNLGDVKIEHSVSNQLNVPNYRSYSYYRKNTNQEKGQIVRICLTGGPCAGKTTAIASIKQDLAQLGMQVFVVPEAASMLMNGGAMIVSSSFTQSQGLIF